MPVNLSQYREVFGVFNSRFIHIKQHNIFKDAFSQGNVEQTIAKFFNILINFNYLVFHKFVSNQSQIYQFVSRQDFLFLCSINICTSYLVISDHN